MESMKSAVNAYQTVQVDAAVLGASPHELIAKLLAKAIDSTIEAKGFMANGDIPGKTAHIKITLESILTEAHRTISRYTEEAAAQNYLEKLHNLLNKKKQ